MNIIIQPSAYLGTIKAPSSKSITHRALICASLADGWSCLYNHLDSIDTNLTIDALKLYGIEFIENTPKLMIKGRTNWQASKDFINCYESGSTLRFLIPVLTYFFNQSHFKCEMSLLHRLNLSDLDELQMDYKIIDNVITINKLPQGFDFKLSDSHTTQLISGLLMIAPIMPNDVKISVQNNIIDPYIHMTLLVMKDFGIEFTINWQGSDHYTILIPKNQIYQARDYYIEGDYSQSANFMVMASLNGRIEIQNLFASSDQGDQAIIELLNEMGANIIYQNNAYLIQQATLKALEIDLSHIPDLGPLLIALLTLTKGTSIVRGWNRLIKKESNRLLSTIDTLKKLSARIQVKNDAIIIEGKKQLEGGIILDSYNDHRIVMMICAISSHFNQPVKVKNAQVINKSYPNFFIDFLKVGGKLQFEEENDGI